MQKKHVRLQVKTVGQPSYSVRVASFGSTAQVSQRRMGMQPFPSQLCGQTSALFHARGVSPSPVLKAGTCVDQLFDFRLVVRWHVL